ncbi:MAG: lipopolysaccharide biosynthesis protein [Adhaeribacter sp.]
MSSVAKKLVGHTAAYGISTIFGRLLNYLLVPLHTAIFSLEGYGIIGGLYAYVGFFNVLYTMGLETAFFRFANRPEIDRQQLYNRALSFLLLTSVLFTGLILVFIEPISAWIDFPDQQRFISWLAVILAVDAITALPFARLRLENKALTFAGIKMANILLNVLGNVFIFLFCHQVYLGHLLPGLQPLVARFYFPEWGVGYVFLINLISNLLLLPMLWRQFSHFRFQLDLAFMKPLLRYGYPIMFMGFAGMVNELLDRILLLEYLPGNFYPGLNNKEVVGAYNACYKLAIFMTLAIQAFRYAGEPFFFSQAREKNSPQTFALVMKWFVIVCTFIFLFVSLHLDIFKRFISNPDFHIALGIVPILLLANLFLGVYYNLSTWFKLTDKTHFGTLIGFGGAAITILGNMLLIPYLGFMGSAWATLACYAGMSLACYVLGQKYYPIPYPVGRMLFYLLVAVSLVLLSQYVQLNRELWRYAFHLGLSAAFLLLVLGVEKPWRQLRG